jgi:hypothetical protein
MATFSLLNHFPASPWVKGFLPVDVKKPEWTGRKRGDEWASGPEANSSQVKMAFSLEEASCGSAKLLHFGHEQ